MCGQCSAFVACGWIYNWHAAAAPQPGHALPRLHDMDGVSTAGSHDPPHIVVVQLPSGPPCSTYAMLTPPLPCYCCCCCCCSSVCPPPLLHRALTTTPQGLALKLPDAARPGASPLSMSLTCPAIRFACGGQAACCNLPGTGEWCGDDFRGGSCGRCGHYTHHHQYTLRMQLVVVCAQWRMPHTLHNRPMQIMDSGNVQQPSYSPPRTPSLSTVHSCAHPGCFAVASAVPSPLALRCLVSPCKTPQSHSPSPSTRDDVPRDDFE